MVSISQNAEGVINSSSHTYDRAGIRQRPIEEQVRYRNDKVSNWFRSRADGYTAEDAAKKVSICTVPQTGVRKDNYHYTAIPAGENCYGTGITPDYSSNLARLDNVPRKNMNEAS